MPSPKGCRPMLDHTGALGPLAGRKRGGGALIP